MEAERQVIFSGVDSTGMGVHGQLRLMRQLNQLLYQDERRKALEAQTPQDREKHFEQANNYRDTIDRESFARLVMGIGCGRGW